MSFIPPFLLWGILMFSLTGTLQLQAPQGLSQVANQIKQQLGNIPINLNVQLSPQAQAQLAQVKNSLTGVGAAAGQAQGNLNTATNTVRTFGNAINGTSGQLNRFSIALRNTGSVSNQMTQRFEESGTALENFARQAGLAARRFIAFTIAAGAILKFVNAVQQGVVQAAQFDRELVRIGQLGGVSRREISALADEVARLSTSFGVSSQELIVSARVLKQAGLSASETKDALEALAQAALAPNFADMASTVESAVAAMRQFNIPAKEMLNVLGSINAVASEFAVDASDIGEAIRRAGGAFASAGGDIQELIALFTSVRATTRESAASIATGLRTIFTRIQRENTVEALRELGINIRRTREEAIALGNVNLAGQFVGAYEAIRRISEGLRGIPTSDSRFSNIIEELGGFRQVSRVIPLIREVETRERSLNVARAGGISLTQSSERAQEALLVRLTKLSEQFQKLFREITSSRQFQQLADVFIKFGEAVAYVVDKLKPLIPLLGVLATASIARSVGTVIPNFARTFFGGTAFGAGQVTRPSGYAFAGGGRVPGTGNRDSVPAALMPNEFVIKQSSVRKADRIAPGFLEQLNRDGVPRFANGGIVSVRPPGGSVGALYLPGGANANQLISGLSTRQNVVFKLKELGVRNLGQNLTGSINDPLQKNITDADRRKELEGIYTTKGTIRSGLLNNPTLSQFDITRLSNSSIDKDWRQKSYLSEANTAQIQTLYNTLVPVYRSSTAGQNFAKVAKNKNLSSPIIDSAGRIDPEAPIAVPIFAQAPKRGDQSALKRRVGPFVVRAAQKLFGPLPSGINANSASSTINKIVDTSLGEKVFGPIFEAAVNAYRGSAAKSNVDNFDVTPTDSGNKNLVDLFGPRVSGKFSDFKLSVNPKSLKDTATKAVRQFGLFGGRDGKFNITKNVALISGRGTNAEFQKFAFGGLVSRLFGRNKPKDFQLNPQEISKAYQQLDKKAGGVFSRIGSNKFSIYNDNTPIDELYNLTGNKSRNLGATAQQAAAFFSPQNKAILFNRDGIDSREELLSIMAHELGHAIDFHAGTGDKKLYASRNPASAFNKVANDKLQSYDKATFEKMIKQNGLEYTTDPAELFADAVSDYLTVKPTKERKNTDTTIKAIFSSIGYANGGLAREVPALLMPGEFVLQQGVTARQGKSRLSEFNRTGDPSVLKFHSGGIVPGFADGGPVVTDNTLSKLNAAFDRLYASVERLVAAFTKAQTQVQAQPRVQAQQQEVTDISLPEKQIRARALELQKKQFQKNLFDSYKVPSSQYEGELQRQDFQFRSQNVNQRQLDRALPPEKARESAIKQLTKEITKAEDKRVSGVQDDFQKFLVREQRRQITEKTGLTGNQLNRLTQDQIDSFVTQGQVSQNALITEEAQIRRLQPNLNDEQVRGRALFNLQTQGVVTDEKGFVGTQATVNQLNQQKLSQRPQPPTLRQRIGNLFGRGTQNLNQEQRAQLNQQRTVGLLALTSALPYLQQGVDSFTPSAQAVAEGGGSSRAFGIGRGISGVLGGAALGAAAGSVLGPVGIGVGAAVGAIYGLADGLKQAEKDLANAKLDVAFRSLTGSIETFNTQLSAGFDTSGAIQSTRTVASNTLSGINNVAASEANGFFGFSNSSFTTSRARQIRERFGGSIGTFQNILTQDIGQRVRGGVSTETAINETIAEYNDLINIIQEATGQTRQQVIQNIRATNISRDFTNQLSQTAARVREFGSQFSIAFAEVNDSIISSAQSINAIVSNLDSSRISVTNLAGQNLSNPATAGFRRDVLSLTSNLPFRGATTLQQGGFAVSDLSRRAPEILAQVLSQGGSSDSIREALQSQFRGLTQGDIGRNIADALANALSSATQTPEQRAAALINPTGAVTQALGQTGATELQEVFQSIAAVNRGYVDNITQLQNAINKLRENFNQLSDRGLALRENLRVFSESTALRRQGVEGNQVNLIDRLPAARNRFNENQRNILGENVQSVGFLNNRLQTAIRERDTISEQIPNATGAALAELTNRFTEAQNIINRTTQVLENYANVQERNAALTDELNRLNSLEASRRNAAQSILTAGPEQLREIRSGFQLAVQARDNGTDITQLSLGNRQRIFSSLQALEGVGNFGGINVRDLRNQLLTGAGFPGLARGDEERRRGIEDEIQRNLREGVEANEGLRGGNRTQQGTLREELTRANNDFLTRLEALFLRVQTIPLQSQLTQQQQQLAQLTPTQAAARQLQNAGLTNNSLNTLLSNDSSTRQSINRIQTERANLGNIENAISQLSSINIGDGSSSNIATALSSLGVQLNDTEFNRLSVGVRSSRQRVSNLDYTIGQNNGLSRAEVRDSFGNQRFVRDVRAILEERRRSSRNTISSTSSGLGFTRQLNNTDIQNLQTVLQNREQLRGANGQFSFDTLDTSVNNLNTSIQNLTTQIQNLRPQREVANEAQRALQLAAGFPGFASGGPVNGSGAGDSVPARLTPGEFVVNRDSARNNLSLLQSINAQRFALGGQAQNLGRRDPAAFRGLLMSLARLNPRELGDDDLGIINRFYGINISDRTALVRNVYAARQRLGFRRGTTAGQVEAYDRLRRERDGEDYLEQDNARFQEAQRQNFFAAQQRRLANIAGGQRFNRATSGLRFGSGVNRVAGASFSRTGGFSAFSFVGDQTQQSQQARSDAILSSVVRNRQVGSTIGLNRVNQRRNIDEDGRRIVRDVDGLEFRFASGGLVGGTGVGDTVPAMLTPGEFVLRRDAVRQIGLQNLESINRMQNGGVVGSSSAGKEIGGGGEDYSKFIQGIAQEFQQFNQTVMSLGDMFGRFQESTQKLAEVLSNMPSSIDLNGSHKVEVIINGAEVMTNLKPEIAAMIEQKTKEVLNNFIKQNLPDVQTS